MSWNCQFCTLINQSQSLFCSACGSQNPASLSLKKPLLPRAITKPISSISNAILDIFSAHSNYIGRQSTVDRLPSNRRPVDLLFLSKGVPPPRPPPPVVIAADGMKPLRKSQSTTGETPIFGGSTLRGSTSTEWCYADNLKLNSKISKTSVEDLDYSMNWICRRCYNVNALKVLQCPKCGENRIFGPKQGILHQNRLGAPPSLPPDADMPPDFPLTSTICSEITTDVEMQDNKSAALIHSAVVSYCRTEQTTFIDDGFSHSDKSIGDLSRFNNDVVGGNIPLGVIWLRPHQIFTKDGQLWPWCVFRDPRSSDIEQGILGDCWLLSAMALIAERPDILEHIVLTKEFSRDGIYQIRVCIDGEWKIILVDDFFPCRKETRSLAFADGRRNQLWVPLIEKALAKQMGSYSKLRAGRTVEGLAILTGAATEVISLEDQADKDIRWARLLSAREAGFIMGCSCGAGNRNVNVKVFQKKGLLSRHAYSILDVKQEEEYRLLRLRNPWGLFVWNGKWSDNWTGWPTDLKRRLILENYETGSFWICYEDFLDHFDSVDIAKVRLYSPWAELRIPIQMGGIFKEDDKAIRLLIEEPTEVCFTLFQRGARSVQDQVDLLVCVHIVTPDGQINEIVTRSPRKLEAFVSTGDIFLKPGQYIIISHSFTTIGTRKIDGCLVIHSSRQVFGDTIACSANMYTDSLVWVTLKEGIIHSSLQGVVPRYLTQDFSGLLLMIDNTLEDKWVHLKADCSKSVNVLSSRNSLDITDIIPPLSRQIVIILTHFEPTESYMVQHQLMIQLSNCRNQTGSLITSSGLNNMNALHVLQYKSKEDMHGFKPLF